MILRNDTYARLEDRTMLTKSERIRESVPRRLRLMALSLSALFLLAGCHYHGAHGPYGGYGYRSYHGYHGYGVKKPAFHGRYHGYYRGYGKGYGHRYYRGRKGKYYGDD